MPKESKKDEDFKFKIPAIQKYATRKMGKLTSKSVNVLEFFDRFGRKGPKI